MFFNHGSLRLLKPPVYSVHLMNLVYYFALFVCMYIFIHPVVYARMLLVVAVCMR